MLVLLDNNVPRGLARALSGHTVIEARERGWATLKNGDLIGSAERAGFHVLVTADKNIRYQQNLETRQIAIVVLTQLRWQLVCRKLPEIAAAVEQSQRGSFAEVEIQYDGPRPRRVS
ncbi:MAG: hypothetical protein ABJC09_04765 [Terriglobia bacterium]